VSNEPDNTHIQDRYARQIADDLEANTKEQEETRAQMAELQERLDQLTQDHAWLSGVQGTLAEKPTAPQPPAEASPESAETHPVDAAPPPAVPEPRQAKKTAGKARKSRAKAAVAEPATAPPAEPSASTPAESKVSPAGAKAKGEPPLRTLILGLLRQHREPRLASEVVAELVEKYPTRVVNTQADTQVVRNALQALVLKGVAERDKQGNSVFYTAAQEDAAETTSGDAVETEVVAAAEAETVEAAEEKVAAEV
jgi:Fe2+ or Zn2+ uptake regulation protein